LGVSDSSTPEYLRGSKDSIGVASVLNMCSRNGISNAFAGNWHFNAIWEGKVCQMGALCPTGFDNPGQDEYGWVCIYDSIKDSLDRIIGVKGPRFFSVRMGDSMEEIQFAKESGNSVYLSITHKVDERVVARALLEEYLQKGWITDGKLVPDKTSKQENARQIAQKVKEARSLQEAIIEAVGVLDLDEGVNRQEIIRRTEAYLSQ